MCGCMCGYVKGWMYGWMDEWVDRLFGPSLGISTVAELKKVQKYLSHSNQLIKK